MLNAAQQLVIASAARQSMVSGTPWIASFLAMTVKTSWRAKRGNPFSRLTGGQRASLAMTFRRILFMVQVIIP
jgi:hypothetical protein